MTSLCLYDSCIVHCFVNDEDVFCLQVMVDYVEVPQEEARVEVLMPRWAARASLIIVFVAEAQEASFPPETTTETPLGRQGLLHDRGFLRA